MANKPLDFQTATVEHVLEAYCHGQKRVLVADEAGLGKTTVASAVVSKVREKLHKEVVEDDGIYCVVYVCSNLQIAQQNIETLSCDGERVDLSQSRLSMQHLVYYEKKARIQNNGNDMLVLSLTPATSFKMTCGIGSVDERALMYACLSLLPMFADGDEAFLQGLSSLFVGTAYKSWPEKSRFYYDKVRQSCLSEYRETIIKAMELCLNASCSDGCTIRDKLIAFCSAKHDDTWNNESNDFVSKLRKMFADISLEVMKPDLVIMDEFQKFSSLIDFDSKDTEEKLVASKFFANKDAYILLLSATPYKPYTTLEELNENNNDEQYENFHKLMHFLYCDDFVSAHFKKVWREYSSSLKRIGVDDINIIKQKHDAAEAMLYHVMSRTERLNEGIIKESCPDIGCYVTSGDIMSFVQMQNLVNACRKFDKRIGSAPVDYTKSAAFQLSFMDYYKLKERISNVWKFVAGKGINDNCLLLDESSVKNYRLKDYGNARLAFAMNEIFGGEKDANGVETLLWVPASHPYYKQQRKNVFTRNSDFSKYLVFSSWGMVPKMLACLLSYESERRLYKRAYHGETYFSDAKKSLLRDGDKVKSFSVLGTVSTYLADLYNPAEWCGEQLTTIKKSLKRALRQKLSCYKGKTVNRKSSVDIYNLLLSLDGASAEVINIPADIEDVLAGMAIGSPAICLYRTFRNMGDESAKVHAEDVAHAMLGIFNNKYGIAAVRCNSRNGGNYFLNVVDYCIQGNLQAVLDEFVHMIGEGKSPDAVADRIKESFVDSSVQPVNTLRSFGTDKKMNMRKHFALDYGNGSQTEKDVEHAINVRTAFNSPFRPFVLASTSVGQEGLDFHWYCRKMIHWNLPSNPQSLEQREGRINRYKCLSVRRNVAKLFPETFSWNEMFSKAAEELRGNFSEMVPYWYLPTDDAAFHGIKVEKIERIVPMYPFSEDESRYSRLIKVLSLYRLTMGQPRQEELLKLLAGSLEKGDAKKLLFDLSPYSRMWRNNGN